MKRGFPLVLAAIMLAAACGDDGGATTTVPSLGAETTAVTTTSAAATTTTAPGGDLDEEAVLGLLRDACEAGDYAMCDVLFFASPSGTEFKDFGDSCGGRNEPAGLCATIYGVSIDLASLRGDCAGGDMLACDMLYAQSPLGSDDEDFGRSCGGRGKVSRSCMIDHGLTTSAAPGDGAGDVDVDAILAGLADECEDGDMTRCDVLFLSAPLGSTLEAFGDSCGGRNEPAGWCGDIYDYEMDHAALRTACSAGDMLSCDMLYIYSPAESDDEEFGRDCGGHGREPFACVTTHGLFTG